MLECWNMYCKLKYVIIYFYLKLLTNFVILRSFGNLIYDITFHFIIRNLKRDLNPTSFSECNTSSPGGRPDYRFNLPYLCLKWDLLAFPAATLLAIFSAEIKGFCHFSVAMALNLLILLIYWWEKSKTLRK